MNQQEKRVIRDFAPIILNSLEVKDIIPYLWQHGLISQSVTEELLELNETRRTKCKKFLDYVLTVDSKCTFEGLLSALRFNNVYDFIADKLRKELVSNELFYDYSDALKQTTTVDENAQGDMLFQSVRKIPILTSERKRLTEFSIKLKHLSHNAEFDSLEKVTCSIKQTFYKDKLNNNKQVRGKMSLADMYFLSMEALVSLRRQKYDAAEDATNYFEEMTALIPFTTDPRISSMVYLARCGSSVAMDTKKRFCS
ncbi:hypothetical protein DPMN_111435 [Dreissena polymorpha]|uniref:CARD domain-containing protein n=1 Tax=Dreissena polymorpha TaxID=45954 RepID=A0A9D4KEF5_DREPO|nr:hypothetical protein DPMN_111435 [Dreissena polymorpha]